MKKLLALFITILLLGCTPKIITNIDSYETSMINSYEKVFSNAQFDSIAVADSISSNLTEWKALPLKDDEGDVFYQYLYIKKLGQNEQIYRLEKIGKDSVFITKRIIK